MRWCRARISFILKPLTQCGDLIKRPLVTRYERQRTDIAYKYVYYGAEQPTSQMDADEDRQAAT